MFDYLLEAISKSFPGAETIGNKYALPKPGGFEMFIEGAGPREKRDKKGRFYVFKKNRGGLLPYPRLILDNLFVLIFSYGDTNELARF